MSRREMRRDDLCSVLGAAAVLLIFLAAGYCEARWDAPAAAEEPVSETAAVEETAAVMPEVPAIEETEATENVFDPYRADIPLDAAEQRLLYRACGETGISYELALSVIWKETGFRNVNGDDGESCGYMQVQKKWHESRMERLGVEDLSDPYGNFLVGTSYLAELLRLYDMDATAALTVYNSGSPASEAGLAYAAAVTEKWEELTADGE